MNGSGKSYRNVRPADRTTAAAEFPRYSRIISKFTVLSPTQVDPLRPAATTSFTKGAFIAHLAWPEVSARINAGAVGVLPVGAGAKEHGPHLPMNTDQVQVEWIAARLAQSMPVLVWPTINYGYYPAFTAYPGSSSLTESVFSAMVEQILRKIRSDGVRRIAILNAGISTIPALRSVVGTCAGVTLVNLYDGSRCRAVSEQLMTQTVGGHADARETSVMLAIDPGRVDLNKAVAAECDNVAPGPLQRTDRGRPNYSPSGVVGDATGAESGKGRRVLDAILEDVADAVGSMCSEHQSDTHDNQ